MMNDNNQLVLLLAKVWYFVQFGRSVCLLPFLNLYFRQLGFNEQTIGIISGIRPWISALSSFIMPYIADVFRVHNIVQCTALICEVVSRFSMFFFETFGSQLSLVLFSDFVQQPVGVIQDSKVVSLCSNSADYGKIRLWGAVSWGTMSILAGYVLQRFNFIGNFLLYCILGLLVLILTVWINKKVSRYKKVGNDDIEFQAINITVEDNSDSIQDCNESYELQIDDNNEQQEFEIDTDNKSEALHTDTNNEQQLLQVDMNIEYSEQDDCAQQLSSHSPKLSSRQEIFQGDKELETANLVERELNCVRENKNLCNINSSCHKQMRRINANIEPRSVNNRVEQLSMSQSKLSDDSELEENQTYDDEETALLDNKPLGNVDSCQDDIKYEGKQQQRSKLWSCDVCTKRIQSLWKLVKERPETISFYFMAVVFGSAFGAIDGYLFLYLQDLGGSQLLMGLTLTFTVSTEIPLFQLFSKIESKIGVDLIFDVVFLAYTIRLLCYAILPWKAAILWMILPVETLHGITFAFAWAGGTLKSRQLATKGYEATFQGVFQCMFFGVGRGLGGGLGGLLYYQYSPRIMFLITAMWVVFGWILTRGIIYCRQFLRKLPFRT
eukprot:TRINITY_DN5533_c0_g1_i2.p1 TRINITY_DN5533_c0_g1~~TRINITY_DN5533_c0_g1_i2.p1  ORF type:complete len:609 (+),score=40.38 TRINITY_DN5533_c0_g1_i2:173-1999(+)